MQDWPDFFEKPYKEMRISNGILGQLYRDISNEKAMEELLRFDWENSIKLEYELDTRILA